jgi:hypothetical protein
LVITSLLVSALLWLLSLDGRSRFWLERWIAYFFWLVVACALLHDFYLAYQQYQFWAQGGATRYLLPEYQPRFFIIYTASRFFADEIVALVLALFWLGTLKRVNAQSGGVFFERGEPHLAATAFFLTGFPGLLFYIPLLAFVYFLWHVWVLKRKKRRGERLPLYSLWPFVGLATILISEFWLKETAWWSKLVFSR